jgi:hypothetical protein
MPSKTMIKTMATLTLTAFAGEIIGKIIRIEHKRAKKVHRMCDELFKSAIAIRERWPLMDDRGVWEIEQRLKYFERNILGSGVTSDVLLWLSRIMLMDCQNGLWDAGSKKTGAIDGLLRLVEDLHKRIDGGDGKGEAEAIMERWIASLEKPLRKVA